MNKRKLNAVMQLHGESQQNLAEYLQMSLSRLNAKINEYRGAQFRQNEIAAIQEHYGLSAEEVNEIIFCLACVLKRYHLTRRSVREKGERHGRNAEESERAVEQRGLHGLLPDRNAAGGLRATAQRRVLRVLEGVFDDVSVEKAEKAGRANTEE